ncbi:hypothetical protein XENOCAPTIV_026191 [Xenoophorus captivus]|uniref:Uncharacterized protein n=1 Tax=Xenoophorus captivus TaxID=1517983 RepID=A0ABV0QWN4_9TELE
MLPSRECRRWFWDLRSTTFGRSFQVQAFLWSSRWTACWTRPWTQMCSAEFGWAGSHGSDVDRSFSFLMIVVMVEMAVIIGKQIVSMFGIVLNVKKKKPVCKVSILKDLLNGYYDVFCRYGK